MWFSNTTWSLWLHTHKITLAETQKMKKEKTCKEKNKNDNWQNWKKAMGILQLWEMGISRAIKKKKNSQQKNFPHKNVEFLIFQGLNHKIKTSKKFS